MTATMEQADSYAARGSRVLHALEARNARALSVLADGSDADAARAHVDDALDRIAALLPTDVQSSRWDDLDALAARLLLEEVARATSGLRLLTTLARVRMRSVADALQAVENAR